MLLTRLFCFFRGYLVITVTGRYPERFLNVCATHHILIWDVFACSDRMFKCSVSMKGFRLLRPIAKKTGVRVKIIEKRGFPMLLALIKKRKWFLVGLSATLVSMIGLNQFIWKLEITGCETISAAYVKQQLADCGLYVGAFRPHIDEKKLQTKMLIQTPELAWLWVDKSGSKVTVQVKERVLPPAIYDNTAFCNLVAAKDGVIDSMIVKNGVPLIKAGDTVREGDILVSGLIVSEKGVESRQVQSEGNIYAKVWYEKSKAFSLFSPIKTETGNKERKYTLHLFGHDFSLFKNPHTSFTEYSQTSHLREANLFGFSLGMGVSYEEFIEENTIYEKQSIESVVADGGAQLLTAIDEETTPDAVLTDKRISFCEIDEETVEVTVIAEYIEDIAKKVFVPIATTNEENQ